MLLTAVEVYLGGDAVFGLIFLACVIGGALAYGISSLFYKDASAHSSEVKKEKRQGGLVWTLSVVFAIVAFIVLMMLFNTPANAPEEDVDPYGIPGATESAPLG